jgi:O-antigen/teichoic acid export membrane protein
MNSLSLSQMAGRVRAAAAQLQADHPGLRQIAVNIGWLFTDNIFRLFSLVLVNAWVVRYLGPARYGDLSYGLALVSLFTPLATLGLTDMVVRDLVKTPDRAAETLGTAFTLVLGGSCAAVALASAVIFVLRPGDHHSQQVVVVLAISTVFQAFVVIDAWFQSQVRSKYVVYARNTALVIASAIKLLGVVLHAPILVFAALYTLESGRYALGLVAWYGRRRLDHAAFRQWRFRTERAKNLLRDSWPLLLQGLAIMVYMRIDQTMLRQMLPDDEGRRAVGLYAAAVRLSEVWFFIPLAITSSVFPAVIRSREQGEAKYRTWIQWLFNVMALTSYSYAILATLLSGFIITLFYGEDYREAAPMFAILAWAGLWVSLGLARDSVLKAENRQMLSFKASLLGAASNVIINLLLIPPLKGVGSAIATTVSYGISAYACFVLFPALKPLGRMQTSALIYPNPLRGSRHE